MGRRANGEGSVYQRKDGTWSGEIRNPEGKRVAVYGPSQAVVLEKLKERRKQFEAGVLEVPKLSTKDLFDRWLAALKPKVKPATYADYEDTLAKYVTPHIGHIPLSRLSPLHLEELKTKLLAAGVSERNQKGAFVKVRMALKKAVGWRILASSPAIGVDLPKYDRRERDFWTKEEADRFLAAAADSRLYALYVLALTTGMRQGELLGLQRADVNFENGRIYIRHNLVEVKGEILGLATPKTKKGVRDFELVPPALRALKKHRELLLKEGRAADAYWFPTTRGGPMLKSNLIRQFKALVEKAGVKDIAFHDLRHTAATLLASSGMDMKDLQVRLGHATLAITSDLYSHYTPKQDERASAVAKSVWGE